MTRQELADLVEKWRARLAPEFRIKLMDKGPPDLDEDDYFATTQIPAPDYPEALIYFPDESLTREDFLVEITVVHELLHSLIRPIGRGIVAEIRDYLPPATANDANDRATSREETAVDRLARALVALELGRPELAHGTRQGSADAWSDAWDKDEPTTTG